MCAHRSKRRLVLAREGACTRTRGSASGQAERHLRTPRHTRSSASGQAERHPPSHAPPRSSTSHMRSQVTSQVSHHRTLERRGKRRANENRRGATCNKNDVRGIKASHVITCRRQTMGQRCRGGTAAPPAATARGRGRGEAREQLGSSGCGQSSDTSDNVTPNARS